MTETYSVFYLVTIKVLYPGLGVICPCPWAIYMYEIVYFLNVFFSENQESFETESWYITLGTPGISSLFSDRGHPRGWFGRKSLPKLADFSLSWAEGEVKMYRMYREIQNLDQ